MKVTRKYDQYRRDLSCDLECESCGAKQTYKGAYDDRYFWDEVIPSHKCKGCGKSSQDLGTKTEHVPTKYSDYEVV